MLNVVSLKTHLPDAIEYTIAYFNGGIAFVVDDHHLPFSPNRDGTHIANIDTHYEEIHIKSTAHAGYQFKLQNVVTKQETAFMIMACPLAAIFDGRYASAYSMILADTIEVDAKKNKNKFCSKRADVWIVSRSMYSMAMEKQRTMRSKEVEKAIMNTGAGFMQFSSKFVGLYEMIKTVVSTNSSKDAKRLMMKGVCPFCEQWSEKFSEMF